MTKKCVLEVDISGIKYRVEGDNFFAAEVALRRLMSEGGEVLPPLAVWGDERDPSFFDLDRFQAEVKEWAYRNFGSPDDGRTIRLEKLYEVVRDLEGQMIDSQGVWFESVRAAVIAVNTAPPDAPSYRPLIGAFEEMGELGHAHLKGEQGIRHTPEQIADKKKDAVGDVLVYLADYCNREGMSLYECVGRAWGEVRQRDWKHNTGIEET